MVARRCPTNLIENINTKPQFVITPAQSESVKAGLDLVSRRYDVTSLVAGVFAVLGFAPVGWHPLGLMSLFIFFAVLPGCTPIRAFVRGWLFGLGMFGAGVSWVQVSIHQFGLPVLAFSVSATALFVAFVALFPACAAWLAQRWTLRASLLTHVLAYAVAWTLLEWIRSWMLTGFPWLTMGYTQTNSPLGGYAPIVGVFGISLLLALTASTLAVLWHSRPRGMHGWLLVGFVATVWISGGVMGYIAWTSPIKAPMEVALIQGNIPQSMKWSPDQRDATLHRYRHLTDSQWGRTQFAIWPETAVPALFAQAKSFLDEVQAQAVATGTDLLLGIPFQDQTSGQYYNSAIALGNSPGVYHKRHLVPFGEYMPLKPLLGPLLDFLSIPMSSFSSGPDDQALLKLAGRAVGISICYEDVFGDEVIQALPEAEFLVNMSNDAWFGDSLAPHQHLQMAQMRAMESGRYMLRSTNTGVSAVIDQRGQLVAVSPQFRPHALRTLVQGYQGLTPYARYGNWPVILTLFCLSILLSILGRSR